MRLAALVVLAACTDVDAARVAACTTHETAGLAYASCVEVDEAGAIVAARYEALESGMEYDRLTDGRAAETMLCREIGVCAIACEDDPGIGPSVREACGA